MLAGSFLFFFFLFFILIRVQISFHLYSMCSYLVVVGNGEGAVGLGKKMLARLMFISVLHPQFFIFLFSYFLRDDYGRHG
jgi:hypothetical protein